MPRFLDDMRAKRSSVMPWFIAPDRYSEWDQYAQKVGEILALDDLPVIQIDNVAEYYFTSSGQEYWDLTLHFPNLAPPFPMAWFEHKMPKVIHSDQCGDSHVENYAPRGRVGVLMLAADRAHIQATEIPGNFKWLLNFEIYVDYGNGEAVGPNCSIQLCVDADGKIIDAPQARSYALSEANKIIESFITWIHPVLLSISFMHCKNVTILDEPVIKPLAKKFHKRTGIWPARTKVLQIEPLKAILRHEGGSHEVGLAKAVHICRGHFRDYREGRGLFGKYHQLVWQPAIVRGGKKGEKPAPREIEIKV